MDIKLNPEELMLGAIEGIMRHIRSLKENRSGVNQQPDHLAWQVKIEGSLAEMAVSKALNFYWNGPAGRGSNDTGNYEVRMSRYKSGCLFLHPHDKDDSIYILAVGLNGSYKIAGWITGKDGKNEKYWKKVSEEREAAYFVPQSDLKSIEIL